MEDKNQIPIEDKIHYTISLWLADLDILPHLRPHRSAEKLLEHIEEGKEKGFTKFCSYKVCTNIYNLVKDNLAICLTSNDEFIRELATLICKEIKLTK